LFFDAGIARREGVRFAPRPDHAADGTAGDFRASIMASPLLHSTAMRVMIIDDDPTFCRYLAEVLTELGHSAEWVSDGLVGFERCLRKSYDVVICDVRMPLILGTELVAELQRDRPAQRVILISAFADDQLKAQAAQAGARLLSKPFDASVLAGTLSEIATECMLPPPVPYHQPRQEQR